MSACAPGNKRNECSPIRTTPVRCPAWHGIGGLGMCMRNMCDARDSGISLVGAATNLARVTR